MMKAFGFAWRLLKLLFGFVVVYPIIFICLTALDALERLLAPVIYGWENSYGVIDWDRTWRHLRSGGAE